MLPYSPKSPAPATPEQLEREAEERRRLVEEQLEKTGSCHECNRDD